MMKTSYGCRVIRLVDTLEIIPLACLVSSWMCILFNLCCKAMLTSVLCVDGESNVVKREPHIHLVVLCMRWTSARASLHFLWFRCNICISDRTRFDIYEKVQCWFYQFLVLLVTLAGMLLRYPQFCDRFRKEFTCTNKCTFLCNKISFSRSSNGSLKWYEEEHFHPIPISQYNVGFFVVLLHADY